ncbi:MAG: metallophosphoesterase [Acidobacteriota bacterium]
MRFLHTSDWQLGMRRLFLDEEAQPRFAAERFDVVRRLGALARDEGCEFAVVAGDVFESNRVAADVVERALDAMAAHEVTWFLLPGNHDALDAASVYRSAELADGRRPANVRLLLDRTPVPVASGGELVGAPWLSKRPGRDLVAELAAELGAVRDGPRLVVAHGRLDTLQTQDRDPAMIRQQAIDDALARGVFQYLALGDRHSALAVGERVRYSGTPEVTDFREERPGEALVVDLEAESCRVQSHVVGQWSFRELEQRLAGGADVDRLCQRLEEVEDKTRTVVRLVLTGELTLRHRARLDFELERARGRFAHLAEHAERSRLTVVPDDIDEDQLELSGFALEAFRELIAAAPEDPVAGDALRLLFRLAEGEG